MAYKQVMVVFRSGRRDEFRALPDSELTEPEGAWFRVPLVQGGAVTLNLAEVLWISVTVSADAAD